MTAKVETGRSSERIERPRVESRRCWRCRTSSRPLFLEAAWGLTAAPWRRRKSDVARELVVWQTAKGVRGSSGRGSTRSQTQSLVRASVTLVEARLNLSGIYEWISQIAWPGVRGPDHWSHSRPLELGARVRVQDL